MRICATGKGEKHPICPLHPVQSRYTRQKFVTGGANSRGRGKVNGAAPHGERRYAQSLYTPGSPSSIAIGLVRRSCNPTPSPRCIDAAAARAAFTAIAAVLVLDGVDKHPRRAPARRSLATLSMMACTRWRRSSMATRLKSRAMAWPLALAWYHTMTVVLGVVWQHPRRSQR